MQTLREAMDKVKDVKPITVNNGVKVVTFEEQRDLAQLEMMEGQDALGGLQINPDGSVARTPITYSAVNPDVYYMNRYCKVKNELFVVIDKRAIQGAQTGSVYIAQVPAAVITRDGNGNLRFDRMITVSDDKFIAEFTDELDNESMAKILPLLEQGSVSAKTTLPI